MSKKTKRACCPQSLTQAGGFSGGGISAEIEIEVKRGYFMSEAWNLALDDSEAKATVWAKWQPAIVQVLPLWVCLALLVGSCWQ